MRHTVSVLLLATACGAGFNAPYPPGVEGEAVMWSICYDERGLPELHERRSEEHSCSSPLRVHHGALPVPVHVDDSMDHDVALRAFLAWEEWMGTPVFELVPESGPGVVELFVNAEALHQLCGRFAAACAPHMYDGESFDFLVVFDDEYADRVDVLAHELGHVLGLAHDHGMKRSIMHPGMAWYLPRLDEADRRVLCGLYRC